MRLVDRDWTVKECLQAMKDIDHLRQDGQWKDGKVPDWARKTAEETHSSAGIMDKVGYEKAALTFRTALEDEKTRVDQLVVILRDLKKCSHGCAGIHCGHHRKVNTYLSALQPELARKIRE